MGSILAPGSSLACKPAIRRTFTTFDELFAAFEKQLLHFIDIKVRGNNVIERLYAAYHARPVPLPADG